MTVREAIRTIAEELGRCTIEIYEDGGFTITKDDTKEKRDEHSGV